MHSIVSSFAVSNLASTNVNKCFRALIVPRDIANTSMCCRGLRSSQQQCCMCHSVLPTPYLLSVHISEQHDSFFASQAAQRMPVFQCLVEGCNNSFCSAVQRHQHLTDLHQIPAESGFDRCKLFAALLAKIHTACLSVAWNSAACKL